MLGLAFIFLSLLVSCISTAVKGPDFGPDMTAPKDHPEELRAELRNQLALRYSSPESYLKLARFHYDQGNKVQAFYISEQAREVFGDDKFTPVFENVAKVDLKMLQLFKNGQEEAEYSRNNPESDEATYYQIKKKYQDLAINSADDPNLTERFFEELLLRLPGCMDSKAMAAKYYLKGKKDKEKALDLYIDLYFYNPHFYDWEYAEYRVKDITSSEKEKWWKQRQESRQPFIELVRNEKNPRILDKAVEDARAKWNPELIPAMMVLMENDDAYVQTEALHTLLKHSEDLKDKDEIRSMVHSKDYIIRAMSAFLIIKCLGDSEFGLLQENLDSGIELVQLDTIQALAFYGSRQGIEYLKSHRPENASKFIIHWWKKMAFEPLPELPGE